MVITNIISVSVATNIFVRIELDELITPSLKQRKVLPLSVFCFDVPIIDQTNTKITPEALNTQDL